MMNNHVKRPCFVQKYNGFTDIRLYKII